jgi:hypothetical protein
MDRASCVDAADPEYPWCQLVPEPDQPFEN